jgi:hypothetical protein
MRSLSEELIEKLPKPWFFIQITQFNLSVVSEATRAHLIFVMSNMWFWVFMTITIKESATSIFSVVSTPKTEAIVFSKFCCLSIYLSM